jgi:hypothetical protein
MSEAAHLNSAEHQTTVGIKNSSDFEWGRLCGLVVRVLGYRSGGPGSIPGTAKKKYWVWNGVHSAS